MARRKELSFEESLAKLEDIVAEMENGGLSLQEMLDRYTEGTALSQNCLQTLDKAEKVIDALVKNKNGKFSTEKLTIE